MRISHQIAQVSARYCRLLINGFGFRVTAAALMAIMLATGSGAAQKHELSDLQPIPLFTGPNRIEPFAPDGRSAIVVKAWRDNRNAHGYDLFLVMMPTQAGASDWNVVALESADPNASDADTLRDDPHTGEDTVTAVRFARGKVDGAPATLILVASREIGSAPIPDPALVRFQVHRLAPNERGLGTADYFQRIDTAISAKSYCNAEKALSQQFGLPLDADYAGPDTDDGCP